MTQKAGAVVKRGDEVLLIFRAKEQDWSFPKGHVEAGESVEQAVLRELKEETGLDVRIIKPLPDHFYLSPFEGEVTTLMFLAEPIDANQEMRTEYANDKLRWVAIDEVSQLLTHDNLKNYSLGLGLERLD